MSDQRVEIIRRKAGLTDVECPKKKIVDLLKTSAIIADKFTGRVTVEIVMNQGGVVAADLITKTAF
jgi:hypothetical protein